MTVVLYDVHYREKRMFAPVGQPIQVTYVDKVMERVPYNVAHKFSEMHPDAFMHMERIELSGDAKSRVGAKPKILDEHDAYAIDYPNGEAPTKRRERMPVDEAAVQRAKQRDAKRHTKSKKTAESTPNTSVTTDMSAVINEMMNDAEDET